MKITLEQIDLLRKRTNAGYKEAKEALEKADGDIVEALAYLDEQGKSKKNKGGEGNGLMDKLKRLIQRGNELKLVVSKDGKDYLRVSLNILILAGLILNFLITPVLVAAVIAVLMGYKIHVEDHKGTHGIEIIRPDQKNQTKQETQSEMREEDYTEI